MIAMLSGLLILLILLTFCIGAIVDLIVRRRRRNVLFYDLRLKKTETRHPPV
jgi:hypothetical protein